MESSTVLVLLLTVVLISSTSPDCKDGRCPTSLLANTEKDQNPFERTADRLNPAVISSRPTPTAPHYDNALNFMEEVPFNENVPEGSADGGFRFPLNDDALADFGILDLTWKHLTGDQLAGELLARHLLGHPVSILLLSNSRIHGLTMESFLPVETTLRELYMDNCSVSLDALYGLSNLKVLNLSNTGLSSFQWYPHLKDSLEVLDLSHNKLCEVSLELSVLTSLRQLYLSHNRIRSVKEYHLDLLPNLEVVSLTMNYLDDASFTSLSNLQLLEIDWNFLWGFGVAVHLPPHRLSLRLASNSWRCTCALLHIRDSYDVLDIDQLKCSAYHSYRICDSCLREFLPSQFARPVANLTKESIEYLGCTGLIDQFHLMRNAVVWRVKHEPLKVMRLALIFVVCAFLVIMAVLVYKLLWSKKKFDRYSWLRVQQTPNLKVVKPNNPQEIPYVKIDTPDI